jgi:hypothetical protein
MNELKDYKEASLNVVRDAKILQESDFKSIANLKDELEDVFIHAQFFRTRTEMEAAILNDLSFPTADAKYWQAVREQNMMFQELIHNSYAYKKIDVEIRMLERQLNNEPDDLQRELIEIQIEEKKFGKMNLEREAKDRIREINEWHEIKQKLIPDTKYSLIDVNEHQLISYTTQWINQFIQINASGSNLNSSEAINIYGQLDKGIKLCKEKCLLNKVIEQFNNPDQIISLLMSFDSNTLPEGGNK